MKFNHSILKKYPFINKTIYVSDGSCIKVKRSSFWKNIYFKRDFRLYFAQRLSTKVGVKNLYKFSIRI